MKYHGLAYILNLLNISPTKMSQTLNIDRSLVSKWKSGTRRIDLNNYYFENLIDFLLFKNEKMGANSLESLLANIYHLSEHNISSNELRKYLKKFIINNDFSGDPLKDAPYLKDSYLAPINIYVGNENTKKSVLNLLDYAENKKECGKLTFIYSEVFHIYMYDNEFRQLWIEKLIKLLDKGFYLDLIFSSSRSAKFIIYLSKLFAHAHCTVLLYKDLSYIKSSFSLHLYHNRMMIFGLFNNSEENFCNYNAVYKDPLSISAYTNIANYIKANSRKLFISSQHTNFINNGEYFNIYTKNSSLFPNDVTSYYYNLIPTYIAMSEDLFYEIAVQSFKTEEKVNSELKIFRQRKKSMIKHLKNDVLVHFYSLHSLKLASKKESLSYTTQDLISLPKLKVTQSQFKRHMDDLSKFLLENENYYICLIPDDIISPISSMHLWCKRNELLCIFDNESPSNLLISEDISFINSFADSLEEYYISCPSEFKEKSKISLILKEL